MGVGIGREGKTEKVPFALVYIKVIRLSCVLRDLCELLEIKQ